METRNNLKIKTVLQLQHNLKVDGELRNASSITKVMIFDEFPSVVSESQIDSSNVTYTFNVSPIEEITSVTNISSGVYSFNISPIEDVGTYYDVMEYRPFSNYNNQIDVDSFKVEDYSFGDADTIKKINVTFDMRDISGNWFANDKAYISMNRNSAIYKDHYVIRNKNILIKPNSSGIISVDLIETDNLVDKLGYKVHYKLYTQLSDYRKNFTIPASTIAGTPINDLPGNVKYWGSDQPVASS